MKKIVTYTALAAMFAIPSAFAGEEVTFNDIDTNADGVLTLEEIQVVSPDKTASDVAIYDTDSDGAISESEYDVWKAAKADKGDDAEMMDDTTAQ